jgi:hypothetical protein
MTAKETIDIEALLYRAYAQQQVDRSIGRKGVVALANLIGLPPSPGLAQSAWQERVDTSAPGAKLAARAKAAGSVADPLLLLHDHVLALADMWFAWRGDDVVVWDRETAAAEGCEIGGQGGGWWLVRQGRAVERLEQAGVMALVIQHARAGSRPDIHADWRKRRGRPAADYCERDARGRKRKGEAMTQAEVQHARALYHAWRSALVLLQAQCEGQIAGYEITGPLAPAAPWLVVSDAAA